jgi:hypothetical protein
MLVEKSMRRASSHSAGKRISNVVESASGRRRKLSFFDTPYAAEVQIRSDSCGFQFLPSPERF